MLTTIRLPCARVNEPLDERHPDLKVHTKRPFNAEPSNRALQEMITPKGQHYRRTHAPVPLVDADAYRLSVGLEGAAPRRFSLADLRRHSYTEAPVTMMCTGNRRGEYNAHGPTMGLPWANGSISTARWGGARMCDVLREAGVTPESAAAGGYRYLTFWGLEDYHVSIPLAKALDPHGDVLLATTMNGSPIPRDHGFPPVVLPQRTFLDGAPCFSQPWPGFSFSRVFLCTSMTGCARSCRVLSARAA